MFSQLTMANTRLLGLLGILCIASVVFCGVESGQDSMLNVFVVPHSHDDVGWVKTIEDYYESEVRFILSTTVDTLMQDATRKFIQVEQGFFTLWWNDERTTDQQRQNLKFLVKNKQWEFVIGGWAMQDEACSTYSADIDQMTEGHQFLLDTFGVTPRLGWQIDPFGASSVTPTLFAMMGFDGHVIQRINWRTKKEMMQNKTMEFIWQGSPSLKQKTQIWTHLLDYNYCSPMGQGFNWEGNPFSNPWITNDNVHNRSVEFARLIKDKTNWYKSSNILIPWGCDFSFQDSLVQFMNMDKIIAYIQANPSIFGMNIKYALLSEFFDAVANDTTTTWPVFGAVDFFPYDDNDNSWWTGYYTSRNQLKGLVRHSEHLLRTVDTLFTVTQAKATMDSAAAYKQIDVLRQAEAAVQHHDGVSGTEKDFVVDDYSARLFNGGNQAMNVTLTALGLLANSTNPTKFTNNTDLLLNLRVGRTVSFVAYNNLAWTRNTVIRLPLNRQDITVLDSNNNVVNFQINNASSDTVNAKYALFVQVHLPALGYNTYFVKVTGTVPTNNIAVLTTPTNGVVIENTFLRVTFDSSSNLITQITNKKSSINIQAQQQTLAYTSYSSGGQNSGAYIFRPTGPASPINGNVAPRLTVQTGPLLSEVTQVFGDAINQGPSYFTQITRLYNVDDISVGNFVEATHVITPVPESTELVTRFSTSMNTNNRFYTDDNGFEMLERIYDPTIQLAIPGNYYPTIYQSYITDGSNSFSVISERTHGVTSQQNGELEVMLQRKTPMDDGRGVDEPLDEDDTITPVLRYVLDTARYSVLLRYKNSYELNFPPSIFYAPTASVESWKNTHRVKYSALSTTLPANVHLLSLKLLNSTSNNYIVRLHHLVGVEEDDKWSRPVHVSLSNLFADFTVNSVTETTLTANKVISQHDVSRDVIVTLNAKDIRTFIVQLVPK